MSLPISQRDECKLPFRFIEQYRLSHRSIASIFECNISVKLLIFDLLVGFRTLRQKWKAVSVHFMSTTSGIWSHWSDSVPNPMPFNWAGLSFSAILTCWLKPVFGSFEFKPVQADGLCCPEHVEPSKDVFPFRNKGTTRISHSRGTRFSRVPL